MAQGWVDFRVRLDSELNQLGFSSWEKRQRTFIHIRLNSPEAEEVLVPQFDVSALQKKVQREFSRLLLHRPQAMTQQLIELPIE